MNSREEISEELSSMGSMLAGLPRRMPYGVPKGYFEQFAGDTQATIKDLYAPEVIPAWGKALPYSIPAGYFEGLNNTIVAAIAADEQMPELPKKTPYITPAGYFETLPEHILLAAKAADTSTKKISLKRRNILLPVRWAAAAVLLITIGLGAYMVFDQPISTPDKILASVPNNEIQDYLQGADRVDVDRIVGNNEVSNMQLENRDIIEYLNETGWD